MFTFATRYILLSRFNLFLFLCPMTVHLNFRFGTLYRETRGKRYPNEHARLGDCKGEKRQACWSSWPINWSMCVTSTSIGLAAAAQAQKFDQRRPPWSHHQRQSRIWCAKSGGGFLHFKAWQIMSEIFRIRVQSKNWRYKLPVLLFYPTSTCTSIF